MSSIAAAFRMEYPGFSLDVDLNLPARGVTALFGHSGSGKTTVLRCFAGLNRAPRGRLVVEGQVWQDEAQGIFLPTHARPLGLVFQEASLFPHLSVRKNLEYGMKRAGNKRGEGFDACVDLLGIRPLLDRAPERLSGGERQRVAIARALLTRPRLLLMDEPLAALDGKRKAEILPYLTRLREELDIPVLYVTHSPDEVARLADHLVLLDNGQVAASGPLAETLARLDLPTAVSDDAGVVVEGLVAGHDAAYHLLALDFPGGRVQVAHGPENPGKRLRFQVRARDVSLSLSERDDSSILNRVPATVAAIADADTPAHVLVRLEAGGTPLLARITRRSRDQLQLQPGKSVWAQIKAVALLA